MSASHEWQEWHLTRKGWVPGSEQIDFVGVKPVAPPSDRVLTNSYHERQSSGFSKLDRYWQMEWCSPNQTEVDRLTQLFGNHPKPEFSKYRAS